MTKAINYTSLFSGNYNLNRDDGEISNLIMDKEILLL